MYAVQHGATQCYKNMSRFTKSGIRCEWWVGWWSLARWALPSSCEVNREAFCLVVGNIYRRAAAALHITTKQFAAQRGATARQHEQQCEKEYAVCGTYLIWHTCEWQGWWWSLES
jgi:hypothetical protein